MPRSPKSSNTEAQPMADKLFDPSNPTHTQTPTAITDTAPGASSTPDGKAQPALAAAEPAADGGEHVPTTHDASYCASGNCPPNTHPAHGTTALPTGTVQYAQDPLVTNDGEQNKAKIDFTTWRHICGLPPDQLAGFRYVVASRHSASYLTSNEWRDLYDQFHKTAVK